MVYSYASEEGGTIIFPPGRQQAQLLPMDETEVEKFRLELLRLKSELEEFDEAHGAAGTPVELDQARVGRLSRMDAMQIQEMALEAARRRHHRLSRVEGALRRIESGEYGCCFVCGEEIDARRLSVDPASTRCMVCAEK